MILVDLVDLLIVLNLRMSVAGHVQCAAMPTSVPFVPLLSTGDGSTVAG